MPTPKSSKSGAPGRPLERSWVPAGGFESGAAHSSPLTSTRRRHSRLGAPGTLAAHGTASGRRVRRVCLSFIFHSGPTEKTGPCHNVCIKQFESPVGLDAPSPGQVSYGSPGRRVGDDGVGLHLSRHCWILGKLPGCAQSFNSYPNRASGLLNGQRNCIESLYAILYARLRGILKA